MILFISNFSHFSFGSDDLLNYEIGDVEDTDLTGADEDELLLSDDGMFAQLFVNVCLNESKWLKVFAFFLISIESLSEKCSRQQKDDGGDLLSESKQNSKQAIDNTSIEPEQHQNNDYAPQQSDSDKIELNVVEQVSGGIDLSSSIETATTSVPSTEIKNEKSPGDVVSSTNKEDEENLSQSSGQLHQTTSIALSDKQSVVASDSYAYCADQNIESTVYDDENDDQSYSNSSEVTNSQTASSEVANSQESSEEHSNYPINFASDAVDYADDDSEDTHVRRNPKTCVEREMPQPLDDHSNNNARTNKNFPRNRPVRPQMSRGNHPYAMLNNSDSNFNRPFIPQFRGQQIMNRGPMLQGPPSEFMRTHGISMMRPGLMQRMPMQMHPGARMPPGIGPPNQRLQRPPFQPLPGMMFQGNVLLGNNQGMPPGKTFLKNIRK